MRKSLDEDDQRIFEGLDAGDVDAWRRAWRDYKEPRWHDAAARVGCQCGWANPIRCKDSGACGCRCHRAE